MSVPTTQLQVGREYVDPREEEVVAGMIKEMEVQLNKLYKDKKMLRQIHTKMHGCVKAAFIVEPGLPDELKVGVFAEPRKYNAWVRFSSANTKPRSDKKNDVRGIAIKLLGVPGEKILPDEEFKNTQDFLLMSSETYFSKSIVAFSPTLAAFTSENKLKLALYILNPAHWKILKKVQASMIPCDNPIAIPYWSTQPYRFGGPDTAVKYALEPSPKNHVVIANKTDYDFLRVNLAQTLNNNEIDFDFFIQFQTNADTMPVEDPTIPWPSPKIKVATLKIIPQSFDSNAQTAFGENLSYNIWHSLPVHRPLGSFNRGRGKIYESMAKFRHERNGERIVEPQDTHDFLYTSHRATVPDAIAEIPASGTLQRTAEIIVDCNKEKAFRYISGGSHLSHWLKTSGPIAGEKKVEVIQGPYSKPGATRKVVFKNGDSVVEELLSHNAFANYSYQVTQFSSFFKNLTDKAYARVWFDTVNDKTRIRWTYYFTYKNASSRVVIALFLLLFYKKFMQHALDAAKRDMEKEG